MARYNAWQNDSHAQCFQDLSWDELTEDRSALFGSILGTANHLLWGDQLWMSRFDGGVGPAQSIAESVTLHDDLQLYLDDRIRTDARITRWADRLGSLDLMGDMEWFSGALQKQVCKPKAFCVTHFFNHETHHRGQIHAMLTAAGAKPTDTDLFVMKDA